MVRIIMCFVVVPLPTMLCAAQSKVPRVVNDSSAVVGDIRVEQLLRIASEANLLVALHGGLDIVTQDSAAGCGSCEPFEAINVICKQSDLTAAVIELSSGRLFVLLIPNGSTRTQKSASTSIRSVPPTSLAAMRLHAVSTFLVVDGRAIVDDDWMSTANRVRGFHVQHNLSRRDVQEKLSWLEAVKEVEGTSWVLVCGSGPGIERGLHCVFPELDGVEASALFGMTIGDYVAASHAQIANVDVQDSGLSVVKLPAGLPSVDMPRLTIDPGVLADDAAVYYVAGSKVSPVELLEAVEFECVVGWNCVVVADGGGEGCRVVSASSYEQSCASGDELALTGGVTLISRARSVQVAARIPSRRRLGRKWAVALMRIVDDPARQRVCSDLDDYVDVVGPCWFVDGLRRLIESVDR